MNLFTDNSGLEADVFDAMSYAANLNFRAGVSVTFLLFPCSRCHPYHNSVSWNVFISK